MNIEAIMQISSQALLTVIYVVGPPLGAAMAVGLLIAVIQSATQIQETSLTFVPKIAAVAITLIFTTRWSIGHLMAFFRELMQRFVGVAQ